MIQCTSVETPRICLSDKCTVHAINQSINLLPAKYSQLMRHRHAVRTEMSIDTMIGVTRKKHKLYDLQWKPSVFLYWEAGRYHQLPPTHQNPCQSTPR